jgi:hypothetical protein
MRRAVELPRLPKSCSTSKFTLPLICVLILWETALALDFGIQITEMRMLETAIRMESAKG